MPVYRIDPFREAHWDSFLQAHPHASVFHTRAWLRALQFTYGYEPLAFTSALPGSALTNAIVFCRIQSFLTGSRLVSVPFADHCQPLVSGPGDLNALLSHLEEILASESCQYFELRGSSSIPDLQKGSRLSRSASFVHHVLDLRPDLETVFRRFHKSCVQRKIRRAEREGLRYDEGCSDKLLRQFYRLLVLNRRRHGLPPQPLAWFFNLRDSLGSALQIRIVSREGLPIGGIVTARYKQRMFYKYGASDARFHSLGAMPLLFWRTVQQTKELGLCELDLGRSDSDDQGLIAFKDHLGASSSTLNYYRYPENFAAVGKLRGRSLVRRLCTRLPSPLLRVVGRLLYRHIG